MALKDTWEDLQDAVQGVSGSGDMASVEPINEIAHAVIDLEKDKENGDDSEIFIVQIGGYVDEDSGELHITSGNYDVAEIITQYDNGKLIVLRMLYNYDWQVYGYLSEMIDYNGIVSFHIINGYDLDHIIVNNNGTWTTRKVQNDGTVDLSDYATKEELNDSIKSAILDSWEAAV